MEAGCVLFAAIRKRDVLAWSEALGVGGTLLQKDAMGRSVALSQDAPAEWIKQAADRGAALEARDAGGGTALQIAYKRGRCRADAVEALLYLGADAAAVVSIGKGSPYVKHAPVKIAAAYGRMEAYAEGNRALDLLSEQNRPRVEGRGTDFVICHIGARASGVVKAPERIWVEVCALVWCSAKRQVWRWLFKG